MDELKSLTESFTDPVLIKNENLEWIHGNLAFRQWLGFNGQVSTSPALERRRDRDEMVLRYGMITEFPEIWPVYHGWGGSLRVRRSRWQTASHGNFLVMTFLGDAETKLLTRDLQELRERQERGARMMSLGLMAAGLAHEMGNPLTVIAGRAWQAREKLSSSTAVVDSDVLSCIEKICHHSDHLMTVVRSLTSFCGRDAVDPRTAVSVRDLVNEVVVLCRDRFCLRQVELRLQGTDCEAFIFCRNVGMKQVLLNLLANAYDSVEPGLGAFVEIDLSVNDGIVAIRVRDSGPGIAPETAGRIFEPFFTTKSADRGTGLGLSIVKGILAEIGGTIELETATPCCFLLRIPELAAVDHCSSLAV